MQDVSTNYDTRSKAVIRRTAGDFRVDWQLNGDYTDETPQVKLLEGERKLNEPLGGVSIAQFDVLLANINKRYTIGSDSPVADYLKVGRRALIRLGFNDELLNIGKGISEVPIVNELKREAKIHFFDELQVLSDFKLSDGASLYQDVRTDLYIWDILDEVYAQWFMDIATFDTDESWTGDGIAETTNHRAGDQAIKLQSTSASEETAALDTSGDPIDIQSVAGEDDNISFFLFVEDVSKIDVLRIRLHHVVDESYADLDVSLLELVTGWNEIVVQRSDFIPIDSTYPMSTWFEVGTSDIGGTDVIGGGEIDWSDINKIEVTLKATTGNNVYVIIDALRASDAVRYPIRHFDMGLQNIPVAAFSGNTALYEVKSACESEGALFYADENGELHFENRQHYNNSEFKYSRHEFTFDRILEYENPRSDLEIINSVKIHLRPRRIVSTKVIWTYGFVTQIDPSETKEVWATFIDPVPTTSTGLVTPVATTDYTANDNEDGSGTNRTANISIAISKFTNGAKLEITNTHTGPIYLRFLQLRGTPAEYVDDNGVIVKVKDQTSIDTYGERPSGGLDIDTKYLASLDYAQTLGQQIIDWYANPFDRAKIRVPALPHLQIGDMITITNRYANTSFLMRIYGISFDLSNETGMKQWLNARSVDPFELLTFFEIGTSEIGGTDVIGV